MHVVRSGPLTAYPGPPAGTGPLAGGHDRLNAMTSSPERNANDLTRFVAAQAALWRVAMLVGRGAPQAEVFDAVATELGQLAGADGASIVRNESDGTATVVAGWGRSGAVIPVGANVSLEGHSVTALVSRTGRSARMDSYADAPGQLAAILREQGIRSTVGAPIVVEGRVWGVVTASMSRDEPLAPDAEVRLAYSTELLAAVIANAQARADLAASRAREAAVADQARRRIERNLHDGVQQQLVALILEVGNAQMNIPAEMPQLRQLLATVKQGLTGLLDDLRDISRGLYPAILADIGLQPALNGLVRRSPVPVELNAHLAVGFPNRPRWRPTTSCPSRWPTQPSMRTPRASASTRRSGTAGCTCPSRTTAPAAPTRPAAPASSG
ncbi:hypothetical protein GCM10027610_066570 [Dactylosporangium cerinum]